MNTQTSNNHQAPRGDHPERFSSVGFIVAAIGSSVGLGNMWKFPYITGEYGGGAFFLLFIVSLILIGLPILLAEMTIGRGGRGDSATAMFNLTGSKYWRLFGLMSVLCAFVIMSYYTVVAGWTLHYTMESFAGVLFRGGDDFRGKFETFAGSYWPVLWQVVVMAGCAWIIAKGVSGGIERFNKILMPGFLLILLLLMVRSLTLPGAGEGVKFFLWPDFGKLSAESVLVALGHAFFSLSLGMGCMLTYGSYVSRKQSLGVATVAVGIGDLLYAFIAGLVIFPTVFSYGLEPGEGVGLAFMALPAAFAQMPFGSLFGGLFFLLLAIAAVTSAVSIIEVPVAYAMNNWKWSRKKAAYVLSAVCLLFGIPAALSVGGVFGGFQPGGKTLFDWYDFTAAYVLMPLGGLVVSLFTGYAWKRAKEEAGLSGFWNGVWMFLMKLVSPILIVLVFLYSVGII